MAVFKIGRLFADYDVDILRASLSGNVLSVAGDVVLSGSTRVDAGRAVRQQIEAMKDNKDEPFVTLQWSQDSSFDGFYRVRDISCDMGQTYLTDGLLAWQATLERVLGSEIPPLESTCSWQLRTNTRSVTSGSFTGVAVPQYGVPGTVFELGPVSGTVSGKQSTLALSTIATGFGSVLTTTDVTVPANGIMGWSVTPANYYYGACKVTTDVGTAAAQLLLGRRADTSSAWIVSNGMVRFFMSSSDVRVEWWDTNAWVQVNATNFRFVAGTLVYQAMTVLRNSPECVVVRLAYSVAATVLRVYVDLFLLRGSTMVYGYMSTAPTSSTWPTTATMGVQTTASVAATALTGGFRATSADGNGNQFVLGTGSPACTDTLATGRTATTAVSSSLSFGIGAFGPTGSAVSAQAAVYEFFAQRSEVTRVVAR